jgi:hypothetical protein
MASQTDSATNTLLSLLAYGARYALGAPVGVHVKTDLVPVPKITKAANVAPMQNPSARIMPHNLRLPQPQSGTVP